MSVQTTTDYSQFKTLAENRNIIQGHVNRLKQAIEDSPKILKAQPILVNEHMEIIDGQHRYTACKELNLPIYYTVVNGLTVKEARKMNVIQRGWSSLDYAESYAKAGNVYYRALLQYRKEHPSITFSVLQFICAGQSSHDRVHMFRSGEFTINRDVEEVDWYLGKLDEIHQISNGEVPLSNSFVAAFVEAVDNHDDFEVEDFISNLKKNPNAYHRVSTVRDGLRMIEDIYNYMKSVNRIRLY